MSSSFGCVALCSVGLSRAKIDDFRNATLLKVYVVCVCVCVNLMISVTRGLKEARPFRGR